MRTNAPFILLDDARADAPAHARLYTDPVRILEAWRATDVRPALEQLSAASRDGLHAAGYLTYEAGFALEPKLAAHMPRNRDGPLLWFALFNSYEAIAPGDVPNRLTSLRTSGGDRTGPLLPDMDARRYGQQARRLLHAIKSGDIYQANLTFASHAAFSGDPVALYARLRGQAMAGYGGLIHTGRDWLISLSPELFFSLKDGEILVRPMKGTVARTGNAKADTQARKALQASEKDRAENLMIVDLMRNDLSRVATPGSVQTQDLFALEAYPSLYQMTSTVRAELAPGEDVASILRAIFPCGSITGAPKIRAMELLRPIEQRARGPYCGAMGRIDPTPPDSGTIADAAFNVAIRTLHFQPERQALRLGLGSAIVADSDPAAEWRECAVKGAFFAKMARRFDLIETMRFEPASGIAHLELHIARLQNSAQALGFAFDRHAARNALNVACFACDAPAQVRLLLSPSGALAVETGPVPAPPSEPLNVAIVPLPVASDDFRLNHKTTDRSFYDDARRTAQDAAGNPNARPDEVIFARPDGLLTEGSFTCLFAGPRKTLRTPPVSHGLLPGILRQSFLDDGVAQESDLRAEDLKNGFWLGNALRGLLSARLI